MRNANHKRGIAISLFVIGITMLNFSRLQGSECIRAIHVVTLLTCGAAIGVFLSNIFMMIRNK